MQGDLDFAVDFARIAGLDLRNHRQTTARRRKPDGTSVTDIEEEVNTNFILAVRARENIRASVRGEERSSLVRGASRVWTIDPNDGTGEYINDSVPDEKRTSCIGISLFENGKLKLSVVHNPFRNELFTAASDSVALIDRRHRIVCRRRGLGPETTYDYCHWSGARFDVRGLRSHFGEPIGCYSAIYQACMVADGRSDFAIFPGDTIHDIAPGALLVEKAGGRVTDLSGAPLDWDDLSRGVLFANPQVHYAVLRTLAAL
jgi:myo-inositol-1(or 4)-monophosphatase